MTEEAAASTPAQSPAAARKPHQRIASPFVAAAAQAADARGRAAAVQQDRGVSFGDGVRHAAVARSQASVAAELPAPSTGFRRVSDNIVGGCGAGSRSGPRAPLSHTLAPVGCHLVPMGAAAAALQSVPQNGTKGRVDRNVTARGAAARMD